MSEQQEEDGTAWSLLIRRAMGVPDIVGSEVAERAMERRLRTANKLAPMDRPKTPTMEQEVLQAVRWAGQAGLLDEWLMEIFDPDSTSAEAHIRTRIVDRTKWTDQKMWGDAIYPMIGLLLTEIRGFVEHHPFQGSYFGGTRDAPGSP